MEWPCPHPRCLFILLTMMVASSQQYEFEMAYQTKCLMEELSNNVLVVLDYKAFHKEQPEQPVPVVVTLEDPSGKQLQERREGSSGQFGFTTTAEGDYKACFTVRDYATAQQTRIWVDWKTGVHARDWDALAKKENLNAMSAELNKLEETVKDILQEMAYLRRREEEMRDINEATNGRVAWFSLGSLFICVSLAVWQLWYLKKFFRRKKLL